MITLEAFFKGMRNGMAFDEVITSYHPVANSVNIHALLPCCDELVEVYLRIYFSMELEMHSGHRFNHRAASWGRFCSEPIR